MNDVAAAHSVAFPAVIVMHAVSHAVNAIVGAVAVEMLESVVGTAHMKRLWRVRMMEEWVQEYANDVQTYARDAVVKLDHGNTMAAQPSAAYIVGSPNDSDSESEESIPAVVGVENSDQKRTSTHE